MLKLNLSKAAAVAFVGILASLALGITWGLREKSSRRPASEYTQWIREDRLHLLDFEHHQRFFISNTGAYSRLSIGNRITNAELSLELRCDQSIQIAPASVDDSIPQRVFNGERRPVFRFKLQSKRGAGFLLGPEVRRCQLTYSNEERKTRPVSVEIVTESEAFTWLPAMLHHQETCEAEGSESSNLSVNSVSGSDEERPYHSLSYPQLGCARGAAQVETLETPESGFFAKTELLLGQTLPREFLDRQDPYAPIDFSKAPRLKAIYLATLVYRADFFGTVMARLLKYHAERGTLVHVVTTRYMMLEKDKALLYSMATGNGNFRLQEFKFHDSGNPIGKAFRYVDSRYRDMHIKLLVTVSDENERENAIITGGRNIHDGFLFRTRPDYSRFPNLIQYGVDDDFVHWNDFEIKIVSRELAWSMAAHLLKFLGRDASTQTLEDFVSPGQEKTVASNGESAFRHLISVPYRDNHALEDLYVTLIDSARHSIRISSPYLRPTARIMEALRAAARRQVEVTIQTRVNLQGDTQAWLYEEVNKESINELYREMKIYHWKENSILHSKFILIDDEVAFVGSVNLSRRSFIQDVENGFLIRSKPLIQEWQAVFESYLAHSERITEALERKWFASLLIYLLQDQF